MDFLNNLINPKPKQASFPGVCLLEDVYEGFMIDQNVIVRPDGVITAGFQLQVAEEEQTSTHENINATLSGLAKSVPPGTVFHFQSVKDYSSYDLVDENDGYFLKKLKSHLGDKPVLTKTIYLYISFDFNRNKTKQPHQTWFRSHVAKRANTQGVDLKKFYRIPENIIKANNLVNTLVSQFSTLEPIKAVERLSGDELKKKLYGYFNLKMLQDSPPELRTTFYDAGNHVRAGIQKIAFVTLHEPGGLIYTHKNNDRGVTDFMSSPIDSLEFPNIINTVIMVPDRDATIKAIENEQLIRSVLQRFTGKAGAVNADDVSKFTTEVLTSNEALVHFEQSVMVWSVDDDRLENCVNSIHAAYAQMNNSRSIVSTTNALNFFFTYAPGSGRDLFYTNLMRAKQAFCYVGLSRPTATEGQGVLFANRSGAPVVLDLFSSKLENKNGVWIGPPGTGKSFSINYWLVQNFENGYDQTIIDIGGSYISVVELLGGKYFRHTPEDPISLNPFITPRDESGNYILDNEKIIFLTSLIFVLWKDSSKGEVLTKMEESILADLISAYFVHVNKNKKAPRLDDFYNFVLLMAQDSTPSNRLQQDLKFFDLNSFEIVLRQYADPAGRYYKILNSNDSKDISEHKLIAFDMQGVDKDPMVYPFMALILVDLIFTKFMKLPLEQRKYLFMDEAWSFLGNSPQLEKFIESMYRTCRKHNAGAVIITQSIEELENSKVGRVIVNTSAVKGILDHRSQSAQLPRIKSFLGFTDLDIEKIASIRRWDTHREFFLKRADLGQVLIVDPGTHLTAAFSTSPEEKKVIRDLILEYRSVKKALDVYVERYKKKTPKKAA